MKFRINSAWILPCMIFSGFFTFAAQNKDLTAAQNRDLTAAQNRDLTAAQNPNATTAKEITLRATQQRAIQAVANSGTRVQKTAQVPSALDESARAEAQLYNELTGKDFAKMGEMDLYSEILTSYQSQNEPEFAAMLNVFLQKHSQSIYADNALFLAGKLALEKKQYGKAVHYFQRIQDQFPRSNKVVSAAFAKGIAYKKMNLDRLALKMFEEVKRKYPGSPESFRAGNEVKLIRAN